MNTPDTAAPADGLSQAQQAATAERAALMADKDFRAKAMDPNGAEWKQLEALAATIAGPEDDSEEALPEVPTTEEDEPLDMQDLQAPATAADYELPLSDDMDFNKGLREGLHKAGVDQFLATTLAHVVHVGTEQKLSDLQISTQYAEGANALQREWGGAWEARLKVAKAEARRIYSSLDERVTGGASYEDWIQHNAALGNNVVAIKALYERGRARAAAKGKA